MSGDEKDAMTAAPTWPENAYPTPAQWVEWFLASSREGQEQIAAKAIGAFEDINRCLSSQCCWIDR